MPAPTIVELYQWLIGKQGTHLPQLDLDGSVMSAQAIEHLLPELETNKKIYETKIARMKAIGQQPDAAFLKTAWFDTSEDYENFLAFISAVKNKSTPGVSPWQTVLQFLLDLPAEKIPPQAFESLFAQWLMISTADAIAWYEHEEEESYEVKTKVGTKVHKYITMDTKEKLSSLPDETQLALSQLVARHYLEEMRTLFKIVTNPIGLLPLFTAHFENLELTAGFILGLLLEKEGLANAGNDVPAELLINENFLYQFFLAYIDINSKKITQLYDILSGFAEAQSLIEQARNTSVMTTRGENAGFEFYSLDRTEHFKGCGLIKMSTAPDKEEVSKFDKSQYILTETGLLYYNKTTDNLEPIAIDETQRAALDTYFANSQQLIQNGKISSLTVPEIREISAVTGHVHLKQLRVIAPRESLFRAVPTIDAFKPLYNLFGEPFLSKLLSFYDLEHNEEVRQLLDVELNSLSDDGVSQENLLQLLNKLARANEGPLLEIIAGLLHKSTLEELIKSENFAVFHLTPYKPDLLNKLDLTQIQHFIESIRPNDNLIDQLILLRTMLNQLRLRPDAEASVLLLVAKIIQILMNNPHLDDEYIIGLLQSVCNAPACKALLQQQAVALDLQLKQAIQEVLISEQGLTPDTFINLSDEWLRLSRKFKVLNEISPDLNDNHIRNKYRVFIQVINAAFAHQGASFDLNNTLGCFFPDEEPQLTPEESDSEPPVREKERTLIELLVASDNEVLWKQIIQLLENPPIQRSNWGVREYGDNTVAVLAATAKNQALIQYLVREKKLSPQVVEDLLQSTAKAEQWDTVKCLIYLKGDGKPSLDSISRVLVAAVQANQLGPLLMSEPTSPLQDQSFFGRKENKIELPADPAALMTLLTANGEERTIQQLLKLSPEFLHALIQPTTVTDYSQRTFENISAIKYAFWSLDWNMWAMMLASLKEAFEAGYLEAEHIREQMLHQYKDLRNVGLNYMLGGKLEEGKTCFDLSPLITALETFVDQHEHWSTKQREHFWIHTIGQLQRLLPANVAQHYCEKDDVFNEFKNFHDTLHRSLIFFSANSKTFESWFPLSDANLLGVQLAVFNHNSNPQGAGGGRLRYANNLPGLISLFKERKIDVEALGPLLAIPLSSLGAGDVVNLAS